MPEDSLYCSVCGAPQLVLTEADVERVAAERAVTPSADAPLPRFTGVGRVRWRPALRIAAMIAVASAAIIGLGSVVPVLSMVGWFAVFSAPMLTLNLYQRRVPGATMGGAVGARIGVVLGILLGFVLTAEYAVAELIYRYPMHNGAKMDQQIATVIAKKISEFTATYGAAAGNAAETVKLFQFFTTPDGHAAMALGFAVMLAGGILVYSVVSCMVLGWLRPLRTRPGPV